MSERLDHNHEHRERDNQTIENDLPDIEKLNQEALEKTTKIKDIEALEETVKNKAVSNTETVLDEKPVTHKSEFGAYAALKGQTYDRTLNRIQNRLSKSERALSKIAHNKTVDSISSGVAKTAARPSGILVGGIVSLFGSLVLLYMSKNYGFEYNFLSFFVFMILGFVAGVLIELSIYAIRKIKH
jgi:hypothetical protein